MSDEQFGGALLGLWCGAKWRVICEARCAISLMLNRRVLFIATHRILTTSLFSPFHLSSLCTPINTLFDPNKHILTIKTSAKIAPSRITQFSFQLLEEAYKRAISAYSRNYF